MSNFFSSKRVYDDSWKVVDSRKFEDEEVAMVEHAEVVPSQYGLSVCFFMKSGGKAFVPLSRDSELDAGDEFPMKDAKILTLERSGETIERVEEA